MTTQTGTNGTGATNTIPNVDDAATAEAVRYMETALNLVTNGAELGPGYIIPKLDTSQIAMEAWLGLAMGASFPLFQTVPSIACGYICDAVRHALMATGTDEREVAIVRIFELNNNGRILSAADNAELITLEKVRQNAAKVYEKEHGEADKKVRRDLLWNMAELPSDWPFATNISGVAASLLEVLEITGNQYIKISVGETSGAPIITYGAQPKPDLPFGVLAKHTKFTEGVLPLNEKFVYDWNADGRAAVMAWTGTAKDKGVGFNYAQAVKRRIGDAMRALGLDECQQVWNGQLKDVRYQNANYGALRVQIKEPNGHWEYLSKFLYSDKRVSGTAYSLATTFKGS